MNSELKVYTRRGITITHGRGALVWDAAGNEYIDCVGGIGVAAAGHANKDLADAIHRQALRITSVSNHFHNDVRQALAETLVSRAPACLTKVYFANSGAESMEGAIKFARFATGRKQFVCAARGFHGRTMGALSATYKAAYKEPFEPLVPGFEFAEYNNADSFERLIGPETAGVIIELVQGEGGVYPAEGTFAEDVEKMCRRHGALLIIDEVQTGIGRTGTFFACEQFQVQPDIVTLAKGLGGGVPIGAVLVSDRVPPMPGKHGSTFGGNPLSCAAALATMEFIEKNKLVQEAGEKGDYAAGLLERAHLPGVVDIRHKGLMLGIELAYNAEPLILELQDRGILVMGAGERIIRLLPPLVISIENLTEAAECIIDVIKYYTTAENSIERG